MGFSNEKTRAALELLEQGMRDEILDQVKESLADGVSGLFSSFLYMPVEIEGGESPLNVRLNFEGGDVAMLNVRDELLELAQDPENCPGRIRLTVEALRALADELSALLPDVKC